MCERERECVCERESVFTVRSAAVVISVCVLRACLLAVRSGLAAGVIRVCAGASVCERVCVCCEVRG